MGHGIFALDVEVAPDGMTKQERGPDISFQHHACNAMIMHAT